MSSNIYAAFTELKNAEKVKQYLVKNSLLNLDYLPIKELGYIYFPLNKRSKVPNAQTVKPKFSFQQKEQPLTIEQILKDKLTKNQLNTLPRSQEVVGTIMILEIPEQFKEQEKDIAEAYLKINKNITTIVKKKGIHSGTFRTRTLTHLAGEKTKETIHLENGIKLKLHLEKTYFSARSANERLRISKLVKPGEEVLIMFSGAAPYPLVIAKNSPAKKIYAIEMNPNAHHYAMENIFINKLTDKIILKNGDVRDILPRIKKRFDRIAMPLPKTGEEFLDIALKKSKKGTIIHLYSFIDEKDIKSEAKKIKEICNSLKYPVKIVKEVTCGQFSPGIFRICFDLKVL